MHTGQGKRTILRRGGSVGKKASGISIGYLLFHTFLALIGRLQIFAGLFLRPLRIILGADGQVVFVDRALSLPGDIEDLDRKSVV